MKHKFTDAEEREIEREARIRVAAERLTALGVISDPPEPPVTAPVAEPKETTLEEAIEGLLQ